MLRLDAVRMLCSQTTIIFNFQGIKTRLFRKLFDYFITNYRHRMAKKLLAPVENARVLILYSSSNKILQKTSKTIKYLPLYLFDAHIYDTTYYTAYDMVCHTVYDTCVSHCL